MSKQLPPAPTASAVGPCPTLIQIVGRPDTGSLPSTIAPPNHPQRPFETVFRSISGRLPKRGRIWLVGCFGLNGPLRQYFSLYRAASQREGERGKKVEESKNVQTTPTRPYCKRSRPLPYCHPNCRTPRHWKFTQHHRTTRPPLRGRKRTERIVRE